MRLSRCQVFGLSGCITIAVVAVALWPWETLGPGWERLDRQTRQELSVEHGRAVKHAAVKWSPGHQRIEKLRLYGPDWKETRYHDGRIER